jgi:beta-glucosidase/6-phospho-beta-glucosidase/beta-galactosidase
MWLSLMLVSATAQGAQLPLPESATLPFPDGFRFGTAVSGFQIDMGCPSLPPVLCEDRGSDWYQFVTDPKLRSERLLFITGEPLSAGPGFFETYPEDLRRAREELGVDSLRLSLEWSRIFPEPPFGVVSYEELRRLASPEGLAYYHGVFRAMRLRGLTPFVTLNHYSLPLWIHDGAACHKDLARCRRKGWADPAVIVPEIAKYAGFAAREFGAEVDHWLTLNEPFSAVVLPSYLLPTPSRSNPPGVRLRLKTAKIATRAMIEAHARMYDAVHAADAADADGDGVAAEVGLVSVFFSVLPARDRPLDRAAADGLRHLLNEMFMDAVVHGELDEGWNGKIVQRSDLKGRLDFVGLNYYVGLRVAGSRLKPFSWLSPFLRAGFLGHRIDDDYAPGINQVIGEAAERYRLPIYVTETGVDQTRDADRGRRWLVSTLAWTREAVARGHDVRGYFYWSLMDNYEWNHGMAQRFGLYAVDGNDPRKERVARPAVQAFGDITRTRSLERALQSELGGGVAPHDADRQAGGAARHDATLSVLQQLLR